MMIITIEREEPDGMSKGNAILKAISKMFDFNTLRSDKENAEVIHEIRI